MASQAPTPEVDSMPSSEARRWHWTPYPLTFAVTGCLLSLVFVVNFPAVQVSHPGYQDGKYGPHFELVDEYQHGWPAQYVKRDSLIALDPPVNGAYWAHASAWRPWTGATTFSMSALIVDVFVWGGVVLAAAMLVQLWRSRRRAIWQIHLIDLLGIVAAIAIVFAWDRHERLQRQQERTLYAAATGLGRAPDDELGAAIPAWLPASWKVRYLQVFGRVQYFSGEPGVACQFPHLRVLQTHAANHELGELLRRMPQLEALDLFMVGFQRGDEAETFTSMRDLPPMPELRGINLYDTNATDADLVWLSKCPQLECIDLDSTKIGDGGLQHLVHLPKLRILAISGGLITDEGCRTLAQITSLEDLYLSSSIVSDAGVAELARLKKLQRLQLEAGASDAAIERLRKELAGCSVNGAITVQ